jgi:hypothetical protein
MKPIEQNEIYENLNQFLKGRGVEMKDGSYSQTIQKGCSLLTDAVNLTQQGMGKAKSEIDKRLEQLRQVIHEKTAPKPPPNRDRTESRSSQSNINNRGSGSSSKGTVGTRAKSKKRRSAGNRRKS